MRKVLAFPFILISMALSVIGILIFFVLEGFVAVVDFIEPEYFNE